MTLTRLNITALILTALLLIAVVVWPVLLEYSSLFFLITLMLVGIPHGAVDHLVHWKKREVSFPEKRRFYLRYLGLIGLFGLAWLVAPDWSFIAFMLISAYHFGHSQLFYMDLPVWLRYPVFTAWGTLILSLITFFNYQECLLIFESLPAIDASWLTVSLLIRLIAGSALICLIGFVFNRNQLSLQTILTEIFCLFLLTVAAVYTNAVFAFTLYFGIWHSFRSMVFEYRDIRHITPDAGSFIYSLLPFSLLALGGIAVSYLILVRFFPEISPYMVFIVLISGLTLPHLIIMDEVYENASH